MQHFNGVFHEDVKEIPKFTISPLQSEDKFIWSGTKNGVFPVTSAYHLQMDLENLRQCSPPTSKVKSLAWKRFRTKEYKCL